jgi:hypothetical protein
MQRKLIAACSLFVLAVTAYASETSNIDAPIKMFADSPIEFSKPGDPAVLIEPGSGCRYLGTIDRKEHNPAGFLDKVGTKIITMAGEDSGEWSIAITSRICLSAQGYIKTPTSLHAPLDPFRHYATGTDVIVFRDAK